MDTRTILVLAGNFVLVAILLVFFGLGRLSLEQLGGALALLAFPSGASVFAALKAKRSADGADEQLVVFLLVGALAASSSGCALFAAQSDAAKQTEAEGSYLAQQLKCADEGATREAIDVCRRGVRARWGIAETKGAGK